MSTISSSVRPELVEGLSFSFHRLAAEGQGFDKLSPNGVIGSGALA
jgi:hypothetical protein